MKSRSRFPAVLLLVPLLLACTGAPDAGEEEEAAPATRESADAETAMQAAAGLLSAPFPGGLSAWSLRLDRSGRDASEFSRSLSGDELRVATGPRGILYREPDAVAEGRYTTSATFAEYDAPPGHREAYGLFFGGADLQGPDQRYTYFLVRADGRYLIKRRTGDETSTVVDWTEDPAVNARTAGDEGQGPLENELSVEVGPEEVVFSANGTEVARVPTAEVDAHGIVGLRINHRLDVGISGFEVRRPAEGM